MDDLFNLMFHGVISTPVENDFTRDNIRATAAQFKYGIFSDPILVERKNEESGQIDRTVTNKKLFSSNAVSSGPLIAVDINPYVEQTEEPTQKPVEQEEVVSPVQQMHNSISSTLNLAGIEIDPADYDTVEDYVKAVNKRIDKGLRNFVQNNPKVSFENILLGLSENGDVTSLKDSEEFQGKTLKATDSIPNAKRLTFVDQDGNESYYNIHYDDGLVIVPDIAEQTHPDTLTSDEAINTILNTTNSFFSNLEEDDLQMFTEELSNSLQGGDISWKTFTMIVNKMIGYLKENYEDDANDVIRDLTNLLNSCPI